MNDDQAALNNFSGRARLFPLPNLVFFPNVIQPLHIFEPRYRQMMIDALADDRLLALVLLQPGWEKDYDQSPAIYPFACIGRVSNEQRLPDGRWNLLLRGLRRIRILHEIPTDRMYRTAAVDLLNDDEVMSLQYVMELRRRLAELVLRRLALNDEARDHLRTLFASEMTLSALCDILAFALPIPLEFKQNLLSVTTVEHRAEALIDILSGMIQASAGSAGGRRFPPEFSPN